MRPRRLPLPGDAAPAALLGPLGADRHPVALSGAWLGGPDAGTGSTVAILGSEPLRVAAPGANPFALLDELPVVAENLDGALAGGGWIGWLGYGLGTLAEPGVLPPPPPPAFAAPDYVLAFYDHLIVHDGERWFFEMLETDERAEALAEHYARWCERLSGPLEPPAAIEGPRLAPAGAGGRGHLAAVAECLEHIRAGDLYQANVCLGLTAEWEGDPLALFARALQAPAPPRFGAVVGGVVSLSPERFLRRRGEEIWTEPIKGTRPRTGDAEADAAALAELERAGKDAAEHVMIVDLMRNDLGRLCVYESVTAQPPRAEPHAGVWQLVSTVSGRLRPGTTNAAVLGATFPPGSVTGAPKVAAMQLIAELESTRRQAYTGAVGIVSPLAGLDLNVAIRTFELSPGRIWLGVGGGVVADSDPAAELAEALVKAAGPLAAVGGAVAGDVAASGPAADSKRVRGAAPAHTAAPSPLELALPPRALEFGPRPDPADGVFETLLGHNGRPQFLAAHLKRLGDSVSALYGVTLSDRLGARVSVAGAGLRRSRIRVLVGPDGEVRIEARPEPMPIKDPPALTLSPWLLPGGLGAHKWIDRELLATLGDADPGTVPLLVDGDGSVLEAGYANVWIVEGDTWITPPADGRILAGVTRAALLANPVVNTRELSFDLARLRRADAVFLTSSVSGRRRAELAHG